MRRAVPVLAATAGGIALLANFRTTPEAISLQSSAALLRVPSTTTTAPSDEQDGGSVGTASTTAAPTTAAPTPSFKTPRATSPPATTPATARTIDGPDVVTRYGDVRVRVTLRGSHLEDVQALQLPNERARSAEISQYAEPRLRQEALQAQSANMHVVSGASYTSEGYIQSLQGALDANH